MRYPHRVPVFQFRRRQRAYSYLVGQAYFFGFVLNCGDKAEIILPSELRKEIQELVKYFLNL